MTFSYSLLLLRNVLCCALLFTQSTILFAQATTEDPVADEQSTVSVTQPATTEGQSVAAAATAAEPPEVAAFLLPAEHHPWARFQPGAWREIQTVSTSYDEGEQVISRGITTQKETLKSVVDGKYVLSVQATVESGGKQIVGEEKQRVLYLATDSVEPLVNSRRLEDGTYSLAGLDVVCQVWEMRYKDDSRTVRDLVHYHSERFPFVLLRKTFDDSIAESGGDVGIVPAETEQQTEVLAEKVPYPIGENVVECCLQRTIWRRVKGRTVRTAMTSGLVPGGDVVAWSNDFDSEGNCVRLNEVTLLDHGLSSAIDSAKIEAEETSQ